MKPAFQTIEYQALDGSFFIGKLDGTPYTDEYDPFVLVRSDGWIVAYYPRLNADGNIAPAAKMVDVIGKQLDVTLLEKAVNTVAAAGSLTVPEISHYDFANPTAAKLFLVAEYQADGNAFTLTMPSANTYVEKSYAFYRSYEPSFTLDNEIIDQVNFVEVNADFMDEIVYGSIYGHFADPAVEPGFIDFGADTAYTFTVWNRDFYAFGALAFEYSGDTLFTVADADFVREILLPAPVGLPDMTFDLTPSAPDKIALPADGATSVVLNPVLSWNPSTAPSYEYCFDTTAPDLDPLTEDCGTSWVSAGSATSVALSNLFYDTTYYWQVRALNSTAVTYADGGAWWSFSTGPTVAPFDFNKTVSLLEEKEGSASKLTASWESSYGAYYYEICIDTTPDCIAPEVWHNVGLATTFSTTALSFDTTYFWQVRAVNYLGDGFNYTYANDDGDPLTTEWLSFSTRNYGKLSPVDGALLFTAVPLEWEPTGGATRYEYCLDTSAPDIDPNTEDCNTKWINVGTATKISTKRLVPNTTYYWQVRATTPAGYIYANTGEIPEWWSFTTSKKTVYPSLFKLTPLDGAVDHLTSVTLTWKYSTTKPPQNPFQYCYFPIDDTDTTPISADDTCTYIDENWISTEGQDIETQATISSLSPVTTYYWQVRYLISSVTNPDGSVTDTYEYADSGDYWSFTTAP